MIKVLIDENVAIRIKDELLKKEYDVVHINDGNKGITDKEVFNKTKSEGRILITGDDDFKASGFKYNVAIIWITPSARFEKDISTKIDWIINNISNYNIEINKAFISIRKDKFFIEYKTKNGILAKVKEREIDFSKMKKGKTKKELAN